MLVIKGTGYTEKKFVLPVKNSNSIYGQFRFWIIRNGQRSKNDAFDLAANYKLKVRGRQRAIYPEAGQPNQKLG